MADEDPGSPPDPAVLREAVRQAERILDQEREDIHIQTQRTEHAARFAVTGVAVAATALVGFAGMGWSFPVAARITVAGGVGTMLVFAARLVALSTGFAARRAVAPGPDAAHIVDAGSTPGFTEEALLVSFLEGTPRWSRRNHQLLTRLQSLRDRSVAGWFLGTGMTLMGLFFVLGGDIFG